MDTATLGYCLLGLALVVFNGFFVLVEFALVKARQTQLEVLQERGNGNATLAMAMKAQIDGYLSAAQLGITLCSLGLGWVGEPAFAHLLEPLFSHVGLGSPTARHTVSIVASFGLITFLLIVFGEMAPKYIGIRAAETSIVAVARPMRLFYILFYVPMTVLNVVSNWVLKVLGFPTVTREETSLSEEELRLMLIHAHREGEMSLDRVLLFENVLDFGDLKASSITVPLARVAMLDLRQPWAANLEVIRTRRYSRYPLCDGSPQRVVGVVHVKDLGIAALSGETAVDLARHRRDVPRAKESMPLEALMRFIQRRPTNLALVTDEPGETIKGIVTLEDILEELVGEIADEFDGELPWRLGDHLSRDCVNLNLQARTPDAAIQELAVALNRRTHGLDPKLLIHKAMGREAEAPTAVGRGVALPHARLEGLVRSYVAYGRTATGIDFKASDGQLVTHVFLILTPKDRPREQLQALARIAAIASSDVLFEQLRAAQTPDAVIELVNAADVSTTLG